jgi:uncharacterized membrane protein YbhN (UPF0104 family)
MNVFGWCKFDLQRYKFNNIWSIDKIVLFACVIVLYLIKYAHDVTCKLNEFFLALFRKLYQRRNNPNPFFFLLSFTYCFTCT